MREWKRGEIQALGSVAKLLVVGGTFVALHAIYLDFNMQRFTQGLPGSLLSGVFIRICVAILLVLAGLLLSFWLWRIQRRTGVSTRPFDRKK